MFVLLAEVDLGQSFAPAQKFNSVGAMVNVLSKAIAFGGGVIIVASIVFAAYKYITANGEAKSIEEAQGAFVNAMIGMLIIVTAYWLTQILAKFLGVQF
ncbi:MAG: hypothetical protein AAB893_03055 [Patescibacteria group bacterium]